MAFNWTKTTSREIKTPNLSISEVTRTDMNGNTPGASTVEVMVSLTQAKYSSLTQARDALQAIVDGLTSLLG